MIYYLVKTISLLGTIKSHYLNVIFHPDNGIFYSHKKWYGLIMFKYISEKKHYVKLHVYSDSNYVKKKK